MTEAAVGDSRIARDLAAEVQALRGRPGCDVLVANSASVVGELLRRLSPEGVATGFTTAGVTALANGVIGLHLIRR